MKEDNFIETKLEQIFKSLLNVEFRAKEEYDYDLFGMEIGIMPTDLVYIYFEVKKQFEIEIKEESIVSGKFSSFNNIKEIIKDALCK